MGQFGATDRVTVSHPNSDQGRWYQMPTGTGIITLSFSDEHLDSGGNAACLGYLYWSASSTGSSPHQIGSTVGPFGALPGPTSFAFSTSGVPADSYIAGGFGPNTSGNTISMDITLYDDLVYCAYGTRLKPGQGIVLVLTEAAIAAAAILVPEVAFLAVAWGALVGLTWQPNVVCSGLPPAFPTFTDADFILGTQLPAPGSIGKFLQAYEHTVWPLYCECVPATGGATPPVSPPVIIPVAPPGVAPRPGPILCDGEDVCATLNAIGRQLLALQLQQTLIRNDVQLIQRQGVPFGYLAATAHAGLTGEGQITVEHLIGVSVEYTTIPSYLGVQLGVPDELLFLGRLNLGSDRGWERRIVLANSPSLVFPISAAITKIGYTFAPGIVATITELVRE